MLFMAWVRSVPPGELTNPDSRRQIPPDMLESWFLRTVSHAGPLAPRWWEERGNHPFIHPSKTVLYFDAQPLLHRKGLFTWRLSYKCEGLDSLPLAQTVDLPLEAVGALSEAFHRAGSPLQGRILDFTDEGVARCRAHWDAHHTFDNFNPAAKLAL